MVVDISVIPSRIIFSWHENWEPCVRGFTNICLIKLITSKYRICSPYCPSCEGNPPDTCGFLTQRVTTEKYFHVVMSPCSMSVFVVRASIHQPFTGRDLGDGIILWYIAYVTSDLHDHQLRPHTYQGRHRIYTIFYVKEYIIHLYIFVLMRYRVYTTICLLRQPTF